MKLHKQIKQRLAVLSQDELLRSMGYHNLKVGHRTLQKFLDTDTIYLWLKTGNFDMKHSSESFLRALIKAADFPASFAIMSLRYFLKFYIQLSHFLQENIVFHY